MPKQDRIYNIYYKMMRRCYTTDADTYHEYGGRGIRVCAEWHTYENFRMWALAHGYAPYLSLDRIDNNGDYTPKNCRWATPPQQANNRRNNRKIIAFGESKNLKEWARDPRCIVDFRTVHYRLSVGWTPEQALTTTQYDSLRKHNRGR